MWLTSRAATASSAPGSVGLASGTKAPGQKCHRRLKSPNAVSLQTAKVMNRIHTHEQATMASEYQARGGSRNAKEQPGCSHCKMLARRSGSSAPLLAERGRGRSHKGHVSEASKVDLASGKCKTKQQSDCLRLERLTRARKPTPLTKRDQLFVLGQVRQELRCDFLVKNSGAAKTRPCQPSYLS